MTLDTTRADAIGPEADGVSTPHFDALAARGRRFRQAYATAPETLPAHASMMTGLYPAGHGVRQNGRALGADKPVLAERLRAAGYATAAFVSSFSLARRFGLARGFDHYDDELPLGAVERPDAATTDKSLAWLAASPRGPVFLWVHYFGPHAPYAPPEDLGARFPGQPYLGEVAAMDEQLGRLLVAFEKGQPAPVAVLVAADHGEGLGDHGEPQHGNLLYQSTMHVPLVLAGPGVPVGVTDAPVSTRRVYGTVLAWAGVEPRGGLLDASTEVVLGEAMKPFLAYGWQPQVMAVEGGVKAIRAGRAEAYDVTADPQERKDLTDAVLSRAVRDALLEYPAPSLEAEAASTRDALGDDERRQLATLGYVSAGSAPVVRKDAPRPADMTALFEVLERASGLFVRGEYAAAVPLFERILAKDPHNLDAVLRLATAHSSLGHDAQARKAFERARELAPRSADVTTYRALHYARQKDWKRAEPMLESVLAASPDRVAALEGLAAVREGQGRLEEAVDLRERIYRLRTPSPAELVRLGQIAMGAGRTDSAIAAFEKARAAGPDRFRHDLELGVLYLSARRFAEARDALDRVPTSHPERAMVLFKRAQVSVLLKETDRNSRIEAARQGANAVTRPLIEKEALFRTP